MTDIEFNKSLRALNKAYRDLFNVIPCISDYSCTRDEYTAALKKAVDEKIEISEILTPVKKVIDKDIII